MAKRAPREGGRSCARPTGPGCGHASGGTVNDVVLTAVTGALQTVAPGSSAALLGPAFRALARFGVLRWLIDRQPLATTFATFLRGPDAPMTFLGAPIVGITPVTAITGNVTVAFAALSYAGTLVVTVVADPDTCPDLPALVAALQDELDSVAVWVATGVAVRSGP